MENSLPRTDRRVSDPTRLCSLLGGVAAVSLAAKRGPFLGTLLYALGAELLTFGATTHHLHELAGLKLPASETPERRIPHQVGIQIRRSVTIERPVDEVYDYFRNFESLPAFMEHLESVKVFDEKRSHWTAKGPMGTSVEWDAEIISDEPNELISWRSVNNPDIETAGSVRFVPVGGDKTLFRVSMQYLPPAGAVGTAVAKLLGEDPEEQIKSDLRRFKHLLESGLVGMPVSQDEFQGAAGAGSSGSAPERFSEKRAAAGSGDAT